MSPDVLVVGSGIVGASIAYQIARRSDLEVLALDKGSGPAEGSTGASSSISRCRYSHPEVVRLALHGQRAYRRWSEFTGLEEPRSEYQRTGVAWMLGGSVEDDLDRLLGAGVSAERLRPDDVRLLFPALSDCIEPFDLTGETPHECRPFDEILYEPDGGYADPSGACADLVDATRQEGGTVRFGESVVEVVVSSGRALGVVTAKGERIDAGLIVNAAGPWCNRLNEMAGCHLEWTLEPTRVQVLYRDLPADLGPLPVLIDAATGIYLRPDAAGARVLFGSVLPGDEEEVVSDPDHFRSTADRSFIDTKIHALHHRIPELEHRGTLSGIAGLYTVNREDVHPVVGPTDVEGWWVANGFSGHGFKLAPMIGAMVARSITGLDAPFDTDVSMGLFGVDRDPIGVGSKTVLA